MLTFQMVRQKVMQSPVALTFEKMLSNGCLFDTRASGIARYVDLVFRPFVRLYVRPSVNICDHPSVNPTVQVRDSETL